MCKIFLEVPLHITGIWDIVWGADEYTSGSVGAGLVIEPPAFITIETTSRDVTILNGRPLALEHQHLARKLLSVNRGIRVICTTSAQLGKGYGLSAALSIAYSVGYHYVKYGKLVLDQVFKLAHLLEVKLLTGLGDVIAEVEGGELEIRKRPGAPGVGELTRVKIGRKPVIVVELERKISTADMLRTLFSRIKLGSRLLEKVLDYPSLETFLEVSYRFSKYVGFLEEDIEHRLRKIKRSMLIGYYCKKQLLVVIPEEEYLDEVYEYLSREFACPCKIFYTREEGLRVEIQS